MYERLKALVMKVLKVPPEPEAPAGAAGSLKVFRASPDFYRYNFYVWLLRQVVLVCVLGGVSVGFGLGALTMMAEGETGGAVMAAGVVVWILFFMLTTGLFSYVTLRMDYEMRWYKVTDRSLLIREGVMGVREMTMTFANIQNISISQGPLQRLFKIADLKVETAGGGGHMAAQNQGHHALNMHVGFFRGVDNAESIRDLMMDRLKKLRSAGLGDEDDHQDIEDKAAAPSDELEVLRAIRDEARSMREAAEAKVA